MPFHVYLVECADGSYYCGYAADVKKRVAAHNAGKGGRYTRARLPVKLAYSEKLSSKRAAMRRERELKALTRKQKEALVER